MSASTENLFSVADNQVWDNLLIVVEKKVNRQIFETWFRPLQFEGCDHNEKVLRLRAPSDVSRDWVNGHYGEIMRQTLKELDLTNYQLDWAIDENEAAENLSAEVLADELADEEDDQSIYFAAPTAALTNIGNGFNPNVFSLRNGSAGDGRNNGAPTFVDIEPFELSLNPKYAFQNFVVGSCNQFAHAAALAVAEAPGKTYNPLYIYGGVGLGKTHLMHAAGHAIKERNRHLRVTYISTEKFMNEMINAIRYDKTQTFREKYRSIDVLLMDDIQFMAGKERTQEEFFHTFNALYDKQKQIVITSDCAPRDIPTLEERLHSRFEWGLISDIEPPDLETKVAILKRKADLDGVELPDDVAFFIAGKIRSNIRELEGSLVRLIAISSLRGLPITKMLAQDALRNIADDNRPNNVSIEMIQNSVAIQYNLSTDELKSKNNARQIAVPRQIAMYLCKRLTKHSFPEIGREFGNKHHTTVIHSVEKIAGLIAKDTNFHRVVSDIIDNICC